MTAAIDWHWKGEYPTSHNSPIDVATVSGRFRLFKEKYNLTLTKHNGYWLKCDTCAIIRFLQKKVPKGSLKFNFFKQVCISQ